MQIRPQEAFPIVYLLSDPNDTGTYYVRSVMRDSGTGTIIQISSQNYVNLAVDGSNSRRFTKIIQAPSDPSGSGRWIDIVTTVYTDSGYTVKSDVYREQMDNYLVAERWNVALGSGGGFTPKQLDPQEVATLLLAAFKEHFSLGSIEEAIKKVGAGHDKTHAFIDAFEFPESVTPPDFEPHKKEIITALAEGFRDIKPADLKPILDLITENERIYHDRIDDVVENIPKPMLPKEVEAVVQPHLEKIHGILGEIQKALPQEQYISFTRDLAEAMKSGKKAPKETDSRVKNLLKP